MLRVNQHTGYTLRSYARLVSTSLALCQQNETRLNSFTDPRRDRVEQLPRDVLVRWVVARCADSPHRVQPGSKIVEAGPLPISVDDRWQRSDKTERLIFAGRESIGAVASTRYPVTLPSPLLLITQKVVPRLAKATC